MEMEVKRFDIVLADLGQTVGSEIGGVHPVLIIQNDIGNKHSPTTIVMPITSKIKNVKQPTHILLKKGEGRGLNKLSMAQAECMRQISKERIIKRLGCISREDEQNDIKMAYYASFGM